MGSVIGQFLGNAVGVAVSPVPIIAVILMLFTPRAVANSLSFLIGWVLGLGLVGAVVLAIGFGASDSGPSTLGGWLKVAIGVLFILLAVKQWRGRPAPGQEPEMPAWMASIDQFSAVKSFGLAFALAAVNPKNLGLTLAAAMTISAGGLSGAQEAGSLAVFVAIASVTVAMPVLANLIAGERAAPTLDAMKAWLSANNNTVMTVLFAILGAKVLGAGIAVVTS